MIAINRLHRRPCAAPFLFALWAIAPLAAAQDNPSEDVLPQEPTDMRGTRNGRPSSLDELFGQDPLDPEGFSSTWMRPENFQGFPVFPPTLGGYGQYPAPPGFMKPPEVDSTPLPPLLPSAPDWPAWIQSKRPVDLPYEPNTAVLVRSADRVWWRPPTVEPLVPLYHYDTTRALPAGSEVEVRHTGDFLLLLYGGGRVVSRGPAHVRVDSLDEHGIALTATGFTRLELTTFDRGLTVALPDGSILDIEAVPDATPTGAPRGPALLFLDRASEPSRYGGRATIFNAGDRPVRWRTAFGPRILHPGYRVTMFLQPPQDPLSGSLAEEGVAGSADGVRRHWSTPGTGAVTWSGARFDVSGGTSLTIDPLLGDPFGIQPAAGEPGAATRPNQP